MKNYTCNDFISLSDKEFYSEFAFIMKDALYKDSKLYIWLIDNMYEIFDKNEDTIKEMLTRHAGLDTADIDKDYVAEALFKYFNGEYTLGECTSLSSILYAFISWKMDFTTKDEYYEIRDMFVPFNLPISISVKDIQPVLDAIVSELPQSEQPFTMPLIKRLGKSFICETVNIENIALALDELNFREED